MISLVDRFYSSWLGTRSRPLPSDALVPQLGAQPSITKIGIFRRASNVNASFDSPNIFQTSNILVTTEIDENIILDRLPHAIGAGYTAGNHKPCLQGTRNGILAEIERWEVDDSDTSVFWLKGVMGCGKSAVAQSVAEHSAASGRLGSSFFCSRDFQDRRNLHLIIPTIAYSLAHQHPSFKTAVVPAISFNPHIWQDSFAVQFDELLIGPLKSTGLRLTIIIDALDECDDDQPVSKFLSALACRVHEIPFIKIFITSRPEDHIRSGFAIPSLRTRVLPLHEVDAAMVDSDIESYVRTKLHEIAKRRRFGISGTWPSEGDIIAIIKKCSGSFIVASIIINFIDDRYSMPQERLDLIVSMPHRTVHEGMSRMDGAYGQILGASFRDVGDGDSRPFDLFRLVMAPIVLAFNPLSRSSLARMLGTSEERIWMSLSQLHSVLIVPDSGTQPIRICHKSFADFLTDAQRCRDPRFYIDAATHHLDLGVRCLRLMNVTLRKNICQLPRYAMNDDVEDLLALREKHIGAALAYACESWAKHLRASVRCNGDTLVGLVDTFFQRHFLSWLEVLSIEGNLRVAVYSLRDVKSWLTGSSCPPSSLLDLIVDCERFVLQFFAIIQKSATHIYHSALSWTPTSSSIRHLYQIQMMTEVKLVNAIGANWDACIRTIPVRHRPHTIVFSHNGASLAIVSPNHVTIVDTMTGVTTFEVCQPKVYSACFSFDDSMVACGVLDQSVGVWDAQTSNLVQMFVGHQDVVRSAAFSPSGKMVASGSDDKTIRIWDISSGSCKCVLEGHSGVVSTVCWSGTDNLVLSGSEDATVRLWDVSEQACLRILRGHTGLVTSVASLSGSFSVGSGSRDGTVNMYHSRSDDALRTISTDQRIESVQSSTDGDKIMYTNLGSATISGLAENAHVSMIKCGGDHVAISPSGTLVASTLVDLRGSSDVKIWSTESRYWSSEMVNNLFQGVSAPLFFAPDGLLMASGSYSHAKIWNMSSGECLFTLDSGSIISIAFSPGSAFVACLVGFADAKKHVRVFNVHTHGLVKDLDIGDDACYVAPSSDGSRLASITGSDITLWDLASGERLARSDLGSSLWWRSKPQIVYAADEGSVFIKSDDDNIRSWRISPAQSPNLDSPSHGNQFASLPLMLLPVREEPAHQDVFAPSKCCHYNNGEEWILDKDGTRILWIPLDQRSLSSEFHGKKVVMTTAKERVYVADFSDTLPS